MGKRASGNELYPLHGYDEFLIGWSMITNSFAPEFRCQTSVVYKFRHSFSITSFCFLLSPITSVLDTLATWYNSYHTACSLWIHREKRVIESWLLQIWFAHAKTQLFGLIKPHEEHNQLHEQQHLIDWRPVWAHQEGKKKDGYSYSFFLSYQIHCRKL